MAVEIPYFNRLTRILLIRPKPKQTKKKKNGEKKRTKDTSGIQRAPNWQIKWKRNKKHLLPSKIAHPMH